MGLGETGPAQAVSPQLACQKSDRCHFRPQPRRRVQLREEPGCKVLIPTWFGEKLDLESCYWAGDAQ